jgi:hypothetical protein
LAQTVALESATASRKERRVGESAVLSRHRGRVWTFAVDTGERTSADQPVYQKLVYAADTSIRRHIKVRAEANPFDPEWQSYFADRAFYQRFGVTPQQAGITPS